MGCWGFLGSFLLLLAVLLVIGVLAFALLSGGGSATEAARRLGGERGDIVFFLIYTEMIAYHDLDFMKERRAALPQVLAGFRALEKRFGESPVRVNEACLLAASAGDVRVARELFNRIGDAPDFQVWRTAENFEMYHLWATGRKSRGLTAAG